MNTRKNTGVSTRGDVQKCMVVGCTKPALYRNAQSNHRGVKRGYCRIHKELAIESRASAENSAAWYAARAK